MKKKDKIFQSSCSELLVDTRLHDPEKAYEVLSEFFDAAGWESSPKLSVELLTRLKNEWIEHAKNYETEPTNVTVYDGHGNEVNLEYGFNGYIDTGFRLDSGCGDWDESCYPFFDLAMKRIGAKLAACDGGSTYGFSEWKRKRGEEFEDE